MLKYFKYKAFAPFFYAGGRAVRLLAAQENVFALCRAIGRAVRLLTQEDSFALFYTCGRPRAARSAIGKDRIKKERSIYNWVN